MLDDLISPMQASFISGKAVVDNIVVTQELIHTIIKFKRKNGFIAIKLDLAKAYGKVGWHFLR